MVKVSREFQVFAKPAGPVCNLACDYCYYLEKTDLYPEGGALRMSDEVLEEYIVQHIEASPGQVAAFSWHGGEPTVLGLKYFRKIVELQRKHQPKGRRIVNGMQTNGTLLDENWCRFLAAEGFAVGLSIDGPRELHDRHRVTRSGDATFERAMNSYRLLRDHGIYCEMLCVVHADNALHPLEVYRSFREIGAKYITFLPLVERHPDAEGGVSGHSVTAEGWGEFLCAIFDEWKDNDIGRIKVQIFEETAGSALGREHALCIFRETCGDVPVVEHNGDFYSCDHFVDEEHRLGNILEANLGELLESPAQRAFGLAKRESLPRECRECEVRVLCNGECPKNRFLRTADGEAGLNYLCAGYKRFFNHCQPFLEQLAAVHRMQSSGQQRQEGRSASSSPVREVGRNDPCPCGSGKKYKKCCLGK